MTHDEAIRRIVAYTQHHDDCALNRCAYCGKPRADRAHGDHDYCEPRLFGGRCSCGLDELLILLRGSGVSSMRKEGEKWNEPQWFVDMLTRLANVLEAEVNAIAKQGRRLDKYQIGAWAQRRENLKYTARFIAAKVGRASAVEGGSQKAP